MKKKSHKWLRDGTIMCSKKDVEIDIRRNDYKVWITVKSSDRLCETTVDKLLDALNK